MQFKIEGKIYPKKNSRQLFRRGGRSFSLPSKNYKESLEYILPQLSIQRNKSKLQFPIKDKISIKIMFKFGDKRRRDLDNMITSICDILQDCEIIVDDNNIECLEASKMSGYKEFVTYIYISTIE